MRTIFNNIISEKNLLPKEDIEYIYNFNMVWEYNTDNYDSISVEKGLIVNNVKQLYGGDYSFNIKGDPKTYRCSYGWAFVENTEKNIELLKVIEHEMMILKVQEKIIDTLKSNLNDLFKK